MLVTRTFMLLCRIVASCLCVVALSCSPGASTGTSRPDAGPVADDVDSDGDTISDVDEGRDTNVDTDNDGTADYLDLDSDGDSIPDYREAGDDRVDSAPRDSDRDQVPDFRDIDSDNNGRKDGLDGVEDVDLDGIANFADLDDDGDALQDVFEIGGDPSVPRDTDDDGTADFQDIDSDADTILDAHERVADPDGDTVPAYIDLDSDGDCIPDEDEAGDGDLSSLPVDLDDDGMANFLDFDSDNDGLGDGVEDANCNGSHDSGETSAVDGDTDGDGVNDLIEVVAETDAEDAEDNPRVRGDFVFLMPYEAPAVPDKDTLAFRTSIQFADVYFTIDTTESMFLELAAMRSPSGVAAIIDSLRCQPTGGTCTRDVECGAGVCFDNACIEDPVAGDGCVPNLWTGVGVFTELDTYVNLRSLQPNPSLTASAIPGVGFGRYEAPLQVPACVANSANCFNNANCSASGVGCPGFRDDAIRINVQITDANDQCMGDRCQTFTAQYAGDQLKAQQIKFIGLYGNGDEEYGRGSAQGVATSLAQASGSISLMGMPLAFPALNAAVVPQTVNAVRELVRGAALSVPIRAEDLPGDDGDSLQFIDYLEVNTSGMNGCTAVSATSDASGDGHHDRFDQLIAGTPVCWDVHPVAQNTTVPGSSTPQLFNAKLTVYGDNSPLDSRIVYFLVPPVIDMPEPID